MQQGGSLGLTLNVPIFSGFDTTYRVRSNVAVMLGSHASSPATRRAALNPAESNGWRFGLSLGATLRVRQSNFQMVPGYAFDMYVPTTVSAVLRSIPRSARPLSSPASQPMPVSPPPPRTSAELVMKSRLLLGNAWVAKNCGRGRPSWKNCGRGGSIRRCEPAWGRSSSASGEHPACN